MASSSSYDWTPTSYDVYLAFRGIDTRTGFISHLYAALLADGIHAFMDQTDVFGGQDIASESLEGIHKSKTYIVVFSENYASSRWCLDELVEILECRKRNRRSVIPIFYDIKPSVVRCQTESFRVAFKKYKSRLEEEKASKWRAALCEVANLSGFVVDHDMSEADMVNEIVDRILREIDPMTLEVAKDVVGIDSRAQEMRLLIGSGNEDVVRIGLYGTVGVGKTTLAKVVYNQFFRRFQGSCFLENVREVSGRPKGLVGLQQQLLDDVLKCKKITIHNVDRGIELIRKFIGRKKVLIILDDVDHQKQLDSFVGPFASGSVIIITTRDEGVLDKLQVELRYRYMVKELDDSESLQLFTQHAFGDTQPSDVFMGLSRNILPHAGGIPLALVVFGSNLSNQPEVVWRFFIKKLQRKASSNIQEKLKISSDAIL